MAAPTVVNGDFAIPALTPGTFDTNPTTPGVGWTWDIGTGSNRCRVHGPGEGWPSQYCTLFANNSSSIECAAYQNLTFDGSPVRLRLRAKRVSSASRLRVAVGPTVLIDETGVTGTWPEWNEFTWELTPTAGVHQLRIAQRGYTGHTLGITNVSFESLAPSTTPGRLVCLGSGRSGLVHVS